MFSLTNRQKINLVAEAVDVDGFPVSFTDALVWELSDPALGTLAVAENTFSADFIPVDGAVGTVIVTARSGGLIGTIDGEVTNPIAVAIRITAGEPGPR